MNKIDSPLVATLLQARDDSLDRSALLQQLLTLVPHHHVNMQATIDIDETLQAILNRLALNPEVDPKLIDGLLQQYGYLASFNPDATNLWEQQLDKQSTINRPTLSEPTKPIVQRRSTTGDPSLDHIINNSPSATIWSANDPVLDRQIVLKEYEGCTADTISSTHNERQFLREAQITGQLEHPNIIPVYTISWNNNGKPYYTMKHIDGDTFAESIDLYHRDNTHHTLQSLRPLLDIFGNICRAISYAHSRGVIHRDLKPTNIAIGNYGEVMVIDWGLGATPSTLSGDTPLTAIATESEFAKLGQTLHGDIQGTPNYMSPEQANKDSVTLLTDVYSLGGILFSILTGRPPRIETPQTVPLRESLDAVIAGDIPTVDSIQPSVPIQLTAMVNKAMQRDPRDRYPDAASLLSDLQAVMVDEPIAICPDTPLGAAARWIRKHPTLVAFGSTILALGLISLSVSTLIIDQSNEHARILLANSRILTREATLLRDELSASHKEAAAAKESALSSQLISIRLQRTAAEQAKLAQLARTEAARQLDSATESATAAKLASGRATKAKLQAYDALKETESLKKRSQQLATTIRMNHAQQLTTHAEHLIGLDRPSEAILPLMTAITMPANDIQGIDGMLSLANSLMDRSISLLNIKPLEYSSTNLLPTTETNRSTAMACVSPDVAGTTYQLMYLQRNHQNVALTPVVRQIPEIPVFLLRNVANQGLVMISPKINSTTISILTSGSSKSPISFTLGFQVTSAILSNNSNQIIVGTQTGGVYSMDIQDGLTKTILSDVGSPITNLTLHSNSSIGAFATDTTVHVMLDPFGAGTSTNSLQLPNPAAALHFKSTKSLVVVTSRGYIIEFPELPRTLRITRFRPPTSGSKLRNISVHPSGTILLDHSSNHLTLVNNNLVPITVQSPLTVSVRSLKFSEDARFVLTTTDRRISTVWDCSTMQPRNLPMHSNQVVIAMELDSANERLYTLHRDTSLRTWKLPPQALLQGHTAKPSQKHTAASSLARFQLMMSVESPKLFGITTSEAAAMLATKRNRDK
jgi:serine/threonine protein kinase